MIAPVLVVRLIPVLPDPVDEVFAKPRTALDVFTLMPIPVELVIVVEPLVKVPADTCQADTRGRAVGRRNTCKCSLSVYRSKGSAPDRYRSA